MKGTLVNVKGIGVEHKQSGESLEDVVLKTFINGKLTVLNVPYKLIEKQGTSCNIETSDITKKEFLPHYVLFQLSNIFKYMKQNNLSVMDYQRFLSTKQKSSSVGSEISKENKMNKQNATTSKGVNRKKVDERNIVVKYVLNEWIDRYYEIKLQANSLQSTFDNEGGDRFQSWLDYFHEKLGGLPEIYQDIIENKYLKIEVDGKYPLDDFVYRELHISRSLYFERKKEALFLLGRALGNSWDI